jgi:hypothetical protein
VFFIVVITCTRCLCELNVFLLLILLYYAHYYSFNSFKSSLNDTLNVLAATFKWQQILSVSKTWYCCLDREAGYVLEIMLVSNQVTHEEVQGSVTQYES